MKLHFDPHLNFLLQAREAACRSVWPPGGLPDRVHYFSWGLRSTESDDIKCNKVHFDTLKVDESAARCVETTTVDRLVATTGKS